MPFYRISEMEDIKDLYGTTLHKAVAGEFMKVAIVTYLDGEAPPPHFHPNEEQFILMLSGKFQMVLDDETRIIENGDLVHVPRNAVHGIRIVESPAVFFTCKSPVGSGEISLDYNKASDAEKLTERLGQTS